MAGAAQSELTWTDIQSWPEDGQRHELIGGQLVVTPAPGLRHQRAVGETYAALLLWAREHGGVVLVGPFDVYVHEREYTEPDVLFVRADRVHLFEDRRIAAPPDLLVEVSSPATRRRDVGAKREIYERIGVAEYWFIDLEHDVVVVHRLAADGYATAVRRPGELLDAQCCPGLALPVEQALQRTI